MLNLVGSKYNNLIICNGECLGFTGLFKHENITDKIKVVEVLSRCNRGSNVIRATGMTTVGAILGGLAGAAASAFINRNKAYFQFLVTMTDEEQFIIETDEPNIIDFMYGYVPSKRRNRNK